MNPFERHLTPNGTEAFYRDDRHEYYRALREAKDGMHGVGRLLSVSGVVKAFDPGGDGLKWWTARWNNVGVASLATDCLDFPEPDPNALDWLTSGPSIDEALERNKLTWKDVLDAAATRGSNVHREALQAMAQGAPVPAFDQLTPEEQGYAMGVVNFWHEHEPEPLFAEQVVVDLDGGVAGRFDLIADIKGPVLVDAKTTETCPRKKQRPFYSVPHQVQLAGYDYLVGKSGYPRTAKQYVLYVDQDGDFQFVRSHATHSDFLLALQVHRAAGEIRAAQRAGARPIEGQLQLS